MFCARHSESLRRVEEDVGPCRLGYFTRGLLPRPRQSHLPHHCHRGKDKHGTLSYRKPLHSLLKVLMPSLVVHRKFPNHSGGKLRNP